MLNRTRSKPPVSGWDPDLQGCHISWQCVASGPAFTLYDDMSHASVCVYACVCIMHVPVYVCMYVRVYVCMYVRMYVCMCIYIYIHAEYIYIYIYIHTYIHTQTDTSSYL